MPGRSAASKPPRAGLQAVYTGSIRVVAIAA
jgi:hypothetical protein